jgi:xanthine dehydrogenase YagS FAD-binding subunit
MKSFTNVNPRDIKEALGTLSDATRDGRHAAIAGGGSDLIQLMRERIVTPDVLVNLKAMAGHRGITADRRGLTIGGLTTIAAIASDERIRTRYTVLAEAAENIATPQIRNVGTIAGNVCQRPWCWYYRNGFKCFKNGGNTCFSAAGENEFHAIFGGGPSYIVHPSDTAPALVALDADFTIVSNAGERIVPAREFFTLPTVNPATENVLRDGEILTAIHLPSTTAATRSTYMKVMDRETWTHAVVSAAVSLKIESGVCREARIVLGGVAPTPWALPDVDSSLVGQRITEQVAADAGRRAIAGARPLSKNGYKVELTASVVKRALLAAAQRV